MQFCIAELAIYFHALFFVLCFVMTELPWLGMESGIGSGMNFALFYVSLLFLFHFGY
jgi:hypothetical protein